MIKLILKIKKVFNIILGKNKLKAPHYVHCSKNNSHQVGKFRNVVNKKP